jgi:AGCS family alanine or glycine:cation symporter
VDIVITAALCCFAFATVLGWGLYGVRCAEYLWGGRGWKLFALVQSTAVVVSSVMDTGIIWMVSETVNGLMAIPNLIALALLSPELVRLTIEFKRKKTAPHV